MTDFGNTRIPILGEVGLDTRRTEGQWVAPAMSRQGMAMVQDAVLAWAINGNTFHTQQGDAGTRLAWVETAYDEDQPQFALLVPTGRTVIPLSLEVTVEIMAGTFSHFIWSTTTNNIGSGTSTALTITPMRSDAPFSSGCTANSLYTADATAATGLIEVKRWVDPFVLEADVLRTLEWNIRTSAAIPILVGPATLQFHTHATTSDAEGYLEAVWAEFDTHDVVRT